MKAMKDYMDKKREEEGNIVIESADFNPYRQKLISMSPRGDVEYRLSLDRKSK